MGESRGTTRGYTRRGLLGASAGLGVAMVGGSSAAAGTGRAAPAGQMSQPRADGNHPEADSGGPRGVDGPDDGQVWGASWSGRGIGVRGNGLAGVRGEGTQIGVAGDGFIGVHGTTSIAGDDRDGVGVWAQTEIPGHLALRADGPSRFSGAVEFDGTTAFSRSGVLAVRPGKTSVSKTGLALTEATIILATLQTLVPGVYVHAVQTDPAAGSFTIHLTSAPAAGVSIGWIALG